MIHLSWWGLLHVLRDDRAVQHVERCEERRRAAPFVVMGHGAGAALLNMEARQGPVERLDMRLLIDDEHHGRFCSEFRVQRWRPTAESSRHATPRPTLPATPTTPHSPLH